MIGLFLAYSAGWSWITLSKYYSLHTYVLDLGVSSQLVWSVFRGKFLFVPEKLIYLFISPFYALFPYQPALLVFQSTWIGLGSIPLFYLSKRLGTGSYSVIVPAAYLLYFPMAGVNWFDFHFMALLPTFLFFALYFRLSGHLALSSVFFGLASITDLMAPLIVSITGLVLLLDYRLSRNHSLFASDAEAAVDHRRLDSCIFLAPLLFFLATVGIFGTETVLQYLPAHFEITSLGSYIGYELLFKLLFVFLSLLPFILLAWRAPLWLLLSLPFFLLELAGTYAPYFIPFYFQYPSLYVPGLLLAAVFGLRKLMSGRRISRSTLRKLTAASLIAISVTGTMFLPYSPLNGRTAMPFISGNYSFRTQTTVTRTEQELLAVFSTIPPNASVLIQNNMPQLAQRMNFSMPGLYSGSYLPQFVVTDAQSRFLTLNLFGNYSGNMLYWADSFLASGRYGIYAEISNDLILERGYGGPVRYFAPYILQLPDMAGAHPLFTNVTGRNITMLLAEGSYTLRVSGGSFTDPALLTDGTILPHPHWKISDSNGSAYASVSIYCSSAYSYVTVRLPPAALLNDTVISVIQTG
ncbi:MAG: DUF2079 domain-containing protein [Thermoplasmata archaeon]|nr:DUF2079 domain-containing protein [Candidatus Sysuiplasma jiujiangense]